MLYVCSNLYIIAEYVTRLSSAQKIRQTHKMASLLLHFDALIRFGLRAVVLLFISCSDDLYDDLCSIYLSMMYFVL